MTVILSGFADEISPDPREQLARSPPSRSRTWSCAAPGRCDVADLSRAQLGEFRAMLDDAGVPVSAIGSPIGKVRLDAPLGPELERMRRVAGAAGQLGTTIVRVFSFFVPPGEPPDRRRAGSPRGWPPGR